MIVTLIWFVVTLILVNHKASSERYVLTDANGNNVAVEIDPHREDIAQKLREVCYTVYSPEASPLLSTQKIQNLRTECEQTIRCHVLEYDGSRKELCTEQYEHSMANDILYEGNRFSSRPKYRYSTHSCIGGSQQIDSSKLRQSNFRSKFSNTADSEFRVCKFHNVCLLYGKYPTLVYFQDPLMLNRLSKDFLFSSFTPEDHLHLGYISHYYSTSRNKTFMPLLFVNESLPENVFLHSDRHRIAFLASHSWPNYGHILIDNMLSTFAAALMYNIPTYKIHQIFESQCLKFAKVNPHGKSPSGINNMTNHEECVKHITELDDYLFDHRAIFLDDYVSTGVRICFRTLIAGHASAYSQKAWDLSRGIILRSFRDYVVQRLESKGLIHLDQLIEEDNLILVPLRGKGLAMEDEHKDHLNHVLCEGVKESLHLLQLHDEYKVLCTYPHALTFPEEVQLAQQAKIIVSFHGTISYSTFFVRDDTQVIIVTENKVNEYGKDFHIYSRATHFHTLWLTYDRIQELPTVLDHAIRLSEA